MARHEVQYEISKIVKAVLWFGIAVVLALVGLFAIAAAGALILFEYTGLPAWAVPQSRVSFSSVVREDS